MIRLRSACASNGEYSEVGGCEESWRHSAPSLVKSAAIDEPRNQRPQRPRYRARYRGHWSPGPWQCPVKRQAGRSVATAPPVVRLGATRMAAQPRPRPDRVGWTSAIVSLVVPPYTSPSTTSRVGSRTSSTMRMTAALRLANDWRGDSIAHARPQGEESWRNRPE